MKNTILFLFFIVWGCCCVNVSKSGKIQDEKELHQVTVPYDFELKADFGAAGSGQFGWKSWSLTISSDGKASQETCCKGDEKAYSPLIKTFSLSNSDLKKIVIAINESEFFTLPEKPSFDCGIDEPALILKVSLHGKSHTVMIDETPCGSSNLSSERRFWQIYSIVLKYVPSPNKNKEMKYLIK